MGELVRFPIRFLKGLNRRQQIGLVALVLSWGALCGWVRSYVIIDDVWFPTGLYSTDSLTSHSGCICWGRRRHSERTLESPGYRSSQLKRVPNDDIDTYGHLPWPGIGAASVSEDSPSQIKYWIIPYWSVVLLLTMVCTFLLLIKMRTPKLDNPAASNLDQS